VETVTNDTVAVELWEVRVSIIVASHNHFDLFLGNGPRQAMQDTAKIFANRQCCCGWIFDGDGSPKIGCEGDMIWSLQRKFGNGHRLRLFVMAQPA
jgi:L-ascorbate metabolism protein UlaG (beta-lactamase superfamily)